MQICTLTDKAETQINTLCAENNCYAISLNLKGGGCAGFEYEWGTIENEQDVNEGDEVISAGKGNLVIGIQSLIFLAGTEIDYVKDLVGSTFEIKNPNAQSSCGCGVSVNFNMDTLGYPA